MRHVEHKTSIDIEFKTLRYDGQILYTEQERENIVQISLDLFYLADRNLHQLMH